MDPIIMQLRYILGSPNFQGYELQDCFAFFEWLVAALLLLICVSFAFKILFKLLTR